MSITIVKQFQEGPILSSSVMPEGKALGFMAELLPLIVAHFEGDKKDPVANTVIPFNDGRAHPIEKMLGLLNLSDEEAVCYEIGTAPDGTVVDLWVSYPEDGAEMRIAFTQASGREEIIKDAAQGGFLMNSLRFAAEDLPELLEIFKTDYSVLPSVEADAE